MTSSRLIGRAAELAELEAALHDAADGRPVARLRGRRVGRRQVAHGGRARAGRARERRRPRRDRRVRRARRRGAPLRADRRASCAALARDARPGRSTSSPPARAPSSPRCSPSSAARRASRPARSHAGPAAAVRGAADARSTCSAASGPLALVLEDIHWADRSTRAFLVFLARSLWTERVLVIATYRSDELHRRHPLRPLLAELERDTRARRIELARLTRDELADAARRHPRRRARRRARRAPVRAQRGQPAVHRGAARGAASTAAAGCRRRLRDALMVRDRAPERAGAGGAARALRRAARSRTRCSPRRAGSAPPSCAPVVREAAESNVHRGRRARPLPVPPRAAARGRARRPAARRARRAAPRRSPRALEHQAEESGEDALITAGIAHHYLAGRRPARGARRLACAPPTRPSACTPTARPARCSSARSTSGRACPTREAQAGCDRGELLRPCRPGAHQRRRLRPRRGAADARASTRSTRPPSRARAADLLELAVARPVVARAGVATRARLDRARGGAAAGGRPAARSARGSSRARRRPAMLQGRFSEALPIARGGGVRASRGTPATPTAARPTRSTRWGTRMILLGEVEEGSARLREAIAISPPRVRAHQRVGEPRRRPAPRRPLAGGAGCRRAGARRHRGRGPRQRLAVARRCSTSGGRSATGRPRARRCRRATSATSG